MRASARVVPVSSCNWSRRRMLNDQREVGMMRTHAGQPPSRVPQDRRACQTDQAGDQAIQQQIDDLKKRLEALEQQLAESKKAPPAKAVPEAQSLSTKNGG